MKTIYNNAKLFIAIFIIALFAGCAGITEANLAETDTQALDTPTAAAESPVQSTEAPGYFHSGGEEDMIDVPPEDGYEDRP